MAATIDDRSREIIEAPNYAHVSTLKDDGTVHNVVVWVHTENGRIALNSAQGRDWPANVERDPRVTISVAKQDNPYEYVEVRGRAVETTTEGADEHIDFLAKKYLDKDSYPFRQEGEQRVKFTLAPERVNYVNQG